MDPREFFKLPDETRVSHYADELADARAAAHKQMNTVEDLTPMESEIINQPRPKDKSSYTTSMVFAEITEGIYGAGMIADMDGFRVNEPPRVNEALKIHSIVVDPSGFNADELIEEYDKITIPKKYGGRGPGFYITEVKEEYPPIYGGNFMGFDLGNNEARVAVIQDTRRDGAPVGDGRITTNLAVLVNAGSPEENWLNICALEEGYALDKALAELESK